ncbi:3'-5' exonuclease [Baia soyae]|uniref:DNA polymerase-3 subunit epsilon n=1 Tax=Baia soyae TaxID=1544746 RepID=A0A4R2S3E5_9BACL|nr:3'-5' exonuclease [Baia soyae]TCP70042.1 DNA polymerase-3 subunit epsilon [Baia soyae]
MKQNQTQNEPKIQRCKRCKKRARMEEVNLCPLCYEKKCKEVEKEFEQSKQLFRKWYLKRDWLVLDTESTGGGREDEIIEIGITDAEGTILFESLVKPSQPIPKRTTDIHGITDEMVQDAPGWSEIWPEVGSIIQGKTVLMYASDADIMMIRRTCKKYQLPLISYDPRCVMKMYKQLHRDERFVSLTRALGQKEIEYIPSHRATSDCEGLRLLVLSIGGQLMEEEAQV